MVTERIREGFGETVFELGYEYNGDPLQFTKEEWDRAYSRLEDAAKGAKATLQLLLTKNVGGEKEATSTESGQDKAKYCTGKVLIRQIPAKVEDVIETRIAVVGNGKMRLAPDPTGQRN